MKPERLKEIERIYNSALNIEPGLRKEFLDQACGSDESLRDEVERLFDPRPEEASFLETSAFEMLARGLADDPELQAGRWSPERMIGKSLGHYQITGLLGKGGMGEVYRAKDLNLDRQVAIKVLPEEFTRDAGRVARFRREAKLLACLNHPNVAAIYGLDESDGTTFLVMELVEGETLADRIKAGLIPFDETLQAALQIAKALEAAHENGVIHRDLKPANIKMTPDGKVKVLDFGLAKAFADDQVELNLSNSLALETDVTRHGAILGTAAYISPEQARGKAVDKKADIWAFGCVLFEMLTGQAAFSGKDISEIIAAVIRLEPDWIRLPSGLHWRLDELVKRCMEKEPGNRYHDISDVRIDLEKVLAEPGGATHPVTAHASRKYRWIAAAVVLIAILAVAAIWNFKSNPLLEPPPVISFSFELPREHIPDGLNLTLPLFAVSSDGKKFVYCTPKGIFLRTLDDLEAKLIPGTGEHPEQPFFSPNGEWIGYWSSGDRKLKKIRISGKMPVTISGESATSFLSWNADDTILFSASDGIRRISAAAVDIENSELLIASKTDSLFTPRLLPGGKFVIFTMGTKEGYQIAVQSLQSGERKILTSGSDAYYLSTGHLIYMLGKDLVAIPFDMDTLEVTGGPAPIIPGILRTAGVPQFAVSEAGTIIYLPETPNEVSPNRTLVWVDKNGKEESIGAEPGAYSSPLISPDGTKVAVSVGALSTINIKIWDLADKFMTQKTFENNVNTLPLWTRDGKRIIFYRQTRASFEIHSISANAGGGTATPIYSLQTKKVLPECWMDEKTLLTTVAAVGSGRFEIGALSMNDGSPQWTPLQNEKHNVLQPRISPDDRWMAYTSTESGQYEVWVSRYPDVDKGRWKISKDGGNSPLWAPDGRALFYRNEDDVVMIPIDPAASGFSMGTPKSLFKGQYIRSNLSIGSYEQLRTWDISPDGRRFLMIKEDGAVAGSGVRKINVILNWLEDVRQKAPVK